MLGNDFDISECVGELSFYYSLMYNLIPVKTIQKIVG